MQLPSGVERKLAMNPGAMILRLGWQQSMITTGAVISALGYVVFQLPYDIAAGGVTGLGIIVNHWTGLPVGLFFLLVNIPLFVLGIPGNLAAAMLMGAFMIHGMQPGPLLFQENAQLMYGIYGSLVLASLFLLVVGRFGLRMFCCAVNIPAMVLYPIVIFTCLMGAYLGKSSMFDVGVMLTFGVLGYFMRKFDYSYVAFLIGFILAPEWERSLQQVVIISENDPFMFFQRPVAMALMALTLFVIVRTFWKSVQEGKKKRAETAAATQPMPRNPTNSE